ncbi:MAG: SMI1/KNR4 family protein [Geobacteraceae bacterium]|nr:SMI1/KNR4 family protein [Geobacteraceae bacterium]
MEYSDVVIKQTRMAWEFLEKARPLITYTKLVPVSEEQIVQYEQKQNKIVPPDYRYWLTTYGSGLIEFLEGAVEIVSIYELMESDGRTVSSDDPRDSWKRIYIGYSGAPIAMALDSTIIDENGCAPVIETEDYGNKVDKVLASSWPMYVVRCVIEIASSLKSSTQASTFTAEQIDVINNLAAADIFLIDDALESAYIRAKAHNETICNVNNDEDGNVEVLNSMLDFFDECLEAKKSRKLIPRLLSRLNVIFSKDDAFTKTVTQLEAQVEKGCASLNDGLFFHNKVEPHHAKKLKVLLGHPRRQLRKLAEKGWLRINPGEAEKKAERSWDWLECAENWMTVDKSKRESIRCLREAEKRAKDFTAWNACVDFWKDEIKDNAEARRCLIIAEEHVDYSSFGAVMNLIQLSKCWIEFNDHERAKNVLLRSDTISNVEDRQMLWLAQMWREDFNDIELAKKCLKRAELLAEHEPYSLDDILSEWEEIGDKIELERFKSENREYMNR